MVNDMAKLENETTTKLSGEKCEDVIVMKMSNDELKYSCVIF